MQSLLHFLVPLLSELSNLGGILGDELTYLGRHVSSQLLSEESSVDKKCEDYQEQEYG